eukprot:TRINITY_DN5845_c0_g2_i1.p1 TRINITY_DN5845_c0_g2~~TRINITY_DN5845_c0_g2_i1.p1  ORF type:complete len:575 (+),score=71.40 TRINITY_DN5845_c0_g2_i1:72-1796(+)
MRCIALPPLQGADGQGGENLTSKLPTLLTSPGNRKPRQPGSFSSPIRWTGVVAARSPCGFRSNSLYRSVNKAPSPVDIADTQQLALTAIQCILTGAFEMFLVRELPFLSMACNGLDTMVAEACAQQLRLARARLVVTGEARFVRCERQLHRVQRQSSALLPTSTASENYTAAVDAHGKLFVWGRPGWLEERGRDPYDPKWPSITWPKQALVPTDTAGRRSPTPQFLAVVASRHAILALSKDGQLNFAQVVRSASGYATRIDIHALSEVKDKRMVNLSTRFGQAFAVSDSGEVFAWGLPSGDPERPHLQSSMGFGKIATCLRPTALPCFGPGRTPIRSVSTGVSHTIFVSIFGEVYSVGCSQHGKLGLGVHKDMEKHVLVPQKVRFTCHPSPIILAAAAGLRHSLLMSTSGEVWGFGCNSEGQLATSRGSAGMDSAANSRTLWQPKQLDRLPFFVTGLAAGTWSSFFVTDLGRVYYCGNSSYLDIKSRCFGRPKGWEKARPMRIPGLRRIVEVSVSMELSSAHKWEHALFKDERGSLFGWGHCGHSEFPAPNRRSFQNEVVPIGFWPLPLHLCTE